VASYNINNLPIAAARLVLCLADLLFVQLESSNEFGSAKETQDAD